jgi:hypothetical protein
LLFASFPIAFAQEPNFAGAQFGVSTLAGDARTILAAGSTQISLYKPENSITGQVFAGRHITDYVSVQGSYGWNGNDVQLTAVHILGGVERSYEQKRTTRTHTVAGELMVYFRSRGSAVRPYLSAGPGVARLNSQAERGASIVGAAVLPVPESQSSDVCFRVAVGIDVMLGKRAMFRYTFSETIQRNPISALLDPVGQRNLANFQNLFGLAWRF